MNQLCDKIYVLFFSESSLKLFFIKKLFFVKDFFYMADYTIWYPTIHCKKYLGALVAPKRCWKDVCSCLVVGTFYFFMSLTGWKTVLWERIRSIGYLATMNSSLSELAPLFKYSILPHIHRNAHRPYHFVLWGHFLLSKVNRRPRYIIWKNSHYWFWSFTCTWF